LLNHFLKTAQVAFPVGKGTKLLSISRSQKCFIIYAPMGLKNILQDLEATQIIAFPT
jgi:hypothetical protein